jgi:hypothetical protein
MAGAPHHPVSLMTLTQVPDGTIGAVGVVGVTGD